MDGIEQGSDLIEVFNASGLYFRSSTGVVGPAFYTCNEEECRRFVKAVHWSLRTGAQWRELPTQFGKWNSVFRRYARWEEYRDS